jgi:uncharacterized lipoprotein YmbA
MKAGGDAMQTGSPKMTAGGPTMTRILILLVSVLLVACSGTPVQTQYYLLRSDLEQRSRNLAPSEDFAMGRIVIAPYIEQPGIVLETGNGEIRPARYHQWAEPMREGLQQFLRVEVSEAAGVDVFPEDISQGELVFEVRIDQLHGTASGEAKLIAYWLIRRDREIISTHQFSERQALTSDGYGALAAAEKALLSQLAGRIAGSLKQALEAGG